jgi:uncharacterized protein (TIGR02231 family)
MLALLLPLVLGDPTPLATRIQDVTLYGSTALVRRVAEVGGAGTFVVEGLPEGIDRDNVRVRCQGGDVVNVEVRRRVVDQVPSERVQALRDKLKSLQREQRVLEDDRNVQQALLTHLQSLMSASATAQDRDVQGGKPSVDAWTASWRFASERLGETMSAKRELDWKIEAKGAEIQAVQAEIGRCQGAGTVTLHDVIVEVVAPRRASLDVEYLVGRTGWQPAYDLRASPDLASVELVYRARVWQQTGEDWKDVDLVLSTASPQRGAQGPEPQPVGLSLYEPPRRKGGMPLVSSESEAPAGFGSLGEAVVEAAKSPAPQPFAAVESQGLSVHFRLAQSETIESRDLPTTVLVGNSTLEIASERVCVPALDPTVWLRAKAKNTSPWVMLPGTAAVFFGADYLGPAAIETVQTGQELTLHP